MKNPDDHPSQRDILLNKIMGLGERSFQKSYYPELQSKLAELQKTELALRESEEKYRLLVNQIPAVVFKGYADWSVDFFDNKIEEVTGYTKAEFDSRRLKWSDVILADDFMAIKRQSRQNIKAGVQTIEREYRIRKKDGAVAWIHSIGHLSYDAVGNFTYASGVFFDITARRLAEEALRCAKEEWEATFDSVPDFIMILDKDHRVRKVNRAMAAAVRSNPESLLGRHCYELIHQTNAPPSVCPHVLTLADGQIHTTEVQEMGLDLLVTTSPLATKHGCAVGSVHMARDITQHKRMENALRASEKKYRLVFENAPLGVLHYDQTGTITDCNVKLADIIGTTRQELIGFNMMRQLKDEKMREAVAASFQGEVSYYEGDYLSVTGGKLTPVRVIFQPIYSAEGVFQGGVAIVEDMSGRKQAEEERLRFSKIESLGTLAGGIAHDFNNILMVVLGNVSLAQLDLQNVKATQKRLQTAEDACQKAQRLAQQLLTFARGGEPVKELVNVKNLVIETGTFSCRGSKARVIFNFSDDLWPVKADPGQISQVIQNLIINAQQAMPMGGTITVKGANLELSAGGDVPLKQGKYVKISLHDQGVGIPAQHFSKIFDPYFSTKQTGSGLGLATVYFIVKNHQGHIAVESALGAGSVFHIYLPAVRRKFKDQSRENGKVVAGQGRILVMDDDQMVRETLGRILSRLGYEVDLASDGAEVLKMFTHTRESGEVYAVVILDLTVPGGMGGKETLEQLLQIDPQVKAVVSSGYSEDKVMAEFAQYGFRGVIAKPYRISDLSKVLDRIIRQSGETCER